MILYSIISKHNTQNQVMENYSNSLILSSIYYGWYSEAVQCLRICNPTEHPYKSKGIALTSPPYTYWKQGEKLVLVTEITNTAFPTSRQVKNGDVFLGPVDSYHGRSYRRLSDKEIAYTSASAST
jgi:hypothetical protein